MKLYDGGRAPNPRRVRIFLAEKGVTIPIEPVDLGAKEHRSPAYAVVNPMQQVPALALDDGTVLTESVAICRYIEALHPHPPLFGGGALGSALVEMWNRRVEHGLLLAVMAVFRHSHPGMRELEQPQVADWAEANRPRVLSFLRFLDGELGRRPFVAGADLSVADITALVAIDFLKPARLEVAGELANVRRWHAEMSARPSAAA
jgi:glutathione S-transferase